MTLQNIIDIIQGHAHHVPHSSEKVEHIYIDSRQISQTEDTIFCALIGEKRNGHHFIRDAYNKGIRVFIVSERIEYTDETPDALYITVDDTLSALQRLASHQRTLFSNNVIGITGSNGKTIVKEWLSSILSHISEYQTGLGIIKSPKSYNSQIGVPLSVWKLEPEHSLAIFEAGISKKNEMNILESIIRPNIGLFTNLGDAHGEFFEDNDDKLNEKLQLFKNSERLIYNSDNDIIQNKILEFKLQHPQLELLDWSENHEDSYVHIKEKKTSRNHCLLTISHNEAIYKIEVPFTQNAYIQNAILVITTLLSLKISVDDIQNGLQKLRAVAMRLEMRDAIQSSSIISDTYNSDITSLKVALDFLAQQFGDRKSIILSDIQESGLSAEENIQKIIKLINQRQLVRFIGIGPHMKEHETMIAQALKIPSYFYNTTDEFLSEFSPLNFQKEVILLKGARTFEFERIQHRLELSIHQTMMEVDLNALAHNFYQFKNVLSPQTKTMAMVKAYSYGHGGLEVAQKLQYAGVNYLAVAYADEGIELRNGGVTLPIMVMSPEISGFESMVRWKLEPEIFNIYSLRLFCEAAIKHQETEYPIHIKLDTGMHRLGFREEDLDELISIISQTQTVKIASIFTHLAGSDDKNLNEYTSYQNDLFQKMSQKIIDHVDYTPIRHVSNTAAIINHNKTLEYDMVRIGIGLYGINNTDDPKLNLHNVSTLKTYVVQIRELLPGESVGYNRRGLLTRKSKIATVAIGYADGYLRKYYESKGHMLINGHKAPIIGTVCMDMCMLDVTDIPEVQEGDEVIVWGEKLSVKQLAQWMNTIPYEIFTNISKRVKRLYIND